MNIAENIKKIRIHYNLTQADLGKIAGVTDKAVSKWEIGLAEPRMGVIQKMADYFGITKSAIIDSYDDYLRQYEALLIPATISILTDQIANRPKLQEACMKLSYMSDEEIEALLKILR